MTRAFASAASHLLLEHGPLTLQALAVEHVPYERQHDVDVVQLDRWGR